MYADVVLGMKAVDKSAADPLVELLERKKKARGTQVDTDLTESDLQTLVQEYKSAIKSRTVKPFRRPFRTIVGCHRRGIRLVE